MSRALRLAVCIQEVEQSIKEIDDRNQICGLLVTAMSTMDSADDRAHYVSTIAYMIVVYRTGQNIKVVRPDKTY